MSDIVVDLFAKWTIFARHTRSKTLANKSTFSFSICWMNRLNVQTLDFNTDVLDEQYLIVSQKNL